MDHADTINNAIDYVERRLLHGHRLDLDGIARHCAMSKWHLHRLFLRHTGMNVAAYIRRRRLTHAAHELLTSERRILDIALGYAFSSQEAFSRAFKKLFHMPPDAYRQYYGRYITHKEDYPMNQIQGWIAAGSHPTHYKMTREPQGGKDGQPAITMRGIQEVPEEGFGTCMQMISAKTYRGKRLAFSADVKISDAQNAALWMRIDGSGGEMLGFDNMQDRPLHGTADWSNCRNVLDVPEQAHAVAFGVLLVGAGEVSIANLKLQEAAPGEEVTNMTGRLDESIGELPLKPVNLALDQELGDMGLDQNEAPV